MSNQSRVRFGRIIGMLVALAMFAALPAVASAQNGTEPQGGGNVASGNTQNAGIDQDGGPNQAAIVQQNAGRDANAAVNQEQNVGAGGVGGGGDVSGHGHGGGDVSGFGHGGGDVSGHGHGGGVGGGDVGGVSLARTGFDAWILALVGGVALAGGLGLLAAQRRGRLSA